jgi:CRISPR-associated protein Csm2
MGGLLDEKGGEGVNQRDRGRPERQARPEDEIKKSIGSLRVLKDYTGDRIVADAEKLARIIRGDLKNAQLRNIFGEVKHMEMDFKKNGFSRDRFVLLKPKLAYAANKKWEVRPIKEVLTVCIDRVQDEGDFRTFVNFFEAVLAYHR